MTTIRQYKEFTTNIKNLPAGEYITKTGYSDCQVFKVLGRTATQLKIAPVKTKKDPEWKPIFDAGGFAAHCSNQSGQTWIFDSIDHCETVTLRLKKSKYYGSDKLWGDKHGGEYVANGARCFYDYNF